jgi:allantoate deiminase
MEGGKGGMDKDNDGTDHHRDVSPGRIERDIEAIAEFTERDPALGYSRPTFTDAWKGAVDYVVREATDAGAEMRVHPSGNIHFRRPEVGWETPAWLCGSHLDSVPSGGKYDGVAGVVVALEVFRTAPEAPMELVIFAEEEGTTFGLGMIGSRSWAGLLDAERLGNVRNAAGQSYLEAGAPYGVDPERLATEQLDPGRYRGVVELHIEQGLGLWNAGVPVAAVSRINGRRQYRVTVEGLANHAGSTKMGDRRDALAAAAAIVTRLEELGRRLDAEMEHTVMTVGTMAVEPNAANVIPGSVTFSVDFRAQQEEMLSRGDALLREVVAEITEERQVHGSVEQTEGVEPSPLSQEVSGRLVEAGTRLGMDVPTVPSGALHDAAILAPFLPTAMLFVPSRDGISHNPAEFSRTEDIAAAGRVMREAVRS